jgi:hypothetical protein
VAFIVIVNTLPRKAVLAVLAAGIAAALAAGAPLASPAAAAPAGSGATVSGPAGSGPAGSAPAGMTGAAQVAAHMTAGPTPADTGAPAGHWGRAKPIALGGLKASGGSVELMSCPKPGNCTAAGRYQDAKGTEQVFVVSEVKGTWGKAAVIPGLNSLNKGTFDGAAALSCASPGNCAIGGAYPNAAGEAQPFVADSVHGVWGRAHTLIGVKTGMRQFTAIVTAMSCPKPGFCTAGVSLPSIITASDGSPVIVPNAYLADEVSGNWSFLKAVSDFPDKAGPSAINSVSCWAPGNCLAGGYYSDASRHMHALLVREDAGDWDLAEEVPGITAIPGYSTTGDAEVISVSCPQGSCAVSGGYEQASFDTQDFVADQDSQGSWHPQTVPGSLDLNKNLVSFPFVSCGAPGDCGFTSDYQDASRHDHVLVAAETAGAAAPGSWGNAQDVAGINTSPSAGEQALSCGGAASCVSGGLYQFDSTGRTRAYVVQETGGMWGAARRIAGNLDAGDFSSTRAVSCASPGNCAVGGAYTDAHGNELPFVADESTVTVTSVSLSAAQAGYGREQAVRVVVNVTARTGGTPTGQVTVLANSAPVCVATLTGGRAACAIGPRQLIPGGYRLGAVYSGDQTYAGAASARHPLTVTPEPTTARLNLSAPSVRAGHEQAERLTVAVKPGISGTPGGRVTVRAGSVTVCAITLNDARGACTLSASRLRPGTYLLTAAYAGASPYAAATSGKKTLTITN